MGSVISKINDLEQDQELKRRIEYLGEIGAEISEIQPFGSDFEARAWLETNKEKIIRNRRLIDLLG